MELTRERWGWREDAAVPPFPDDRPLIVFDGVCVLCSGFSRFVTGRDPAARFRLTTVQSEVGTGLMRHVGLDPHDPDTVLLVEDGRVWGSMAAVARILARLDTPLRCLAWPMRMLPGWLTNPLYRLVARNRYRLFGRRETCMIPPADAAERFVA